MKIKFERSRNGGFHADGIETDKGDRVWLCDTGMQEVFGVTDDSFIMRLTGQPHLGCKRLSFDEASWMFSYAKYIKGTWVEIGQIDADPPAVDFFQSLKRKYVYLSIEKDAPKKPEVPQPITGAIVLYRTDTGKNFFYNNDNGDFGLCIDGLEKAFPYETFGDALRLEISLFSEPVPKSVEVKISRDYDFDEIMVNGEMVDLVRNIIIFVEKLGIAVDNEITLYASVNILDRK